MKRRFLLIAAIISISLVGCGRNAENSIVEESSVETSEPLETATPEPTATPEVVPTPDPLPDSSIDFKDIDPEIHATYNESTGEIIVDETMARAMLMNSPLFEERAMTDKYIKCELEFYLEGYYTGRFDGDAWYRFAATGDTTYLNLELSDEELASKIEQKHESLQKVKAEEQAAAEPTEEPSSLFETTNETPENKDYLEDAYAQTAKKYGLTVEELKAILGVTDTSKGNTGGGSSQIATPSTDQSLASNNTTSESNTPSNSLGSDARPGEITVDIWGNAAAAGDGGEIVVHHYSEECGYSIGDTVKLGEFVITYKGDDVWVDESSGKEYYATKESDNYLSWWSWN